MYNDIREPKQQRSIIKKDKIIDAGWRLISKNGYYNTNTVEIAKEAGVSTGIVYQYFKDKHDILIAGIKKYGDEIFFPVLKLNLQTIDIDNFYNFAKNIVDKYIKEHKISQSAHEEIMSMVHTDSEIAKYYYEREMNLTNNIYNVLLNKDISKDNLREKVHIIINMIDNLCHEVVYHKHKELNYDVMIDVVINSISMIISGN